MHKPEYFKDGIKQPLPDGFPYDDNTAGEEIPVTVGVVRDYINPTPASNRDALEATHKSLSSNALSLMMKKNQDYACESDLFRNFRYFGPLGVLVRLSDKLSRLRTFEERDTFSVTDESLRDTIEDAINYLVIYYCMKTEAK
jgi:hypothetical protein